MKKIMANINKIILMLAIASPFSVALADDPIIYSWRAENGNMVFSENKPTSDIDYKVVSVGKPTVVDTKTPQKSADGKDVKIDQSDIEKLANSKLADENKEVLEKAQSILEVTITSPVEDNGSNKFSKEGKIEILTSPKLSADDKPVFKLDGTASPSQYEGGHWIIPRPTPGEKSITISGTTADGKEIKSINKGVIRVFNGTIKQMKNTGNYNRAAR